MTRIQTILVGTNGSETASDAVSLARAGSVSLAVVSRSRFAQTRRFNSS
jgi:hypothetical protein